MRTLVKWLLIFGGVAGIAASTTYNIHMGPGWGWQALPLAAIGAMLVLLAVALWWCWEHGKYGLVCLLIPFIIVSEFAQFARVTERAMISREEARLKLDTAAAQRLTLERHVQWLERSARAETSVRLDRALADQAKVQADAARISSERHCARQCRVMLKEQVNAAAERVTAARAEMAREKREATEQLPIARKALAAVPRAASTTPLADSLKIGQIYVDLGVSAAISLALNVASCLVLFIGLHVGGDRLTPIPSEHVQQFALGACRRVPSEIADLRDLRTAYLDWCAGRGEAPVEAAVFAAELGVWLSSQHLLIENLGEGEIVIHGLAPKHPMKSSRLIESQSE